MQDPTADDAETQAELERLRAEVSRLKQEAGQKDGLRLKVSGKGAVSVYGLGRFPVTLYQEQWQRLLAISDEIRSFIDEHREELKTKA